jgi:hypothetical protein
MSPASSEQSGQATANYPRIVIDSEADDFKRMLDDFAKSIKDKGRSSRNLRQSARSLYRYSQDLMNEGVLDATTVASCRSTLEPHLGFHEGQTWFSFGLVASKDDVHTVPKVEYLEWDYPEHDGCFDKKACEGDLRLIGFCRYKVVLEKKELDSVPGTFQVLSSQEALEEAIQNLRDTGGIAPS